MLHWGVTSSKISKILFLTLCTWLVQFWETMDLSLLYDSSIAVFTVDGHYNFDLLSCLFPLPLFGAIPSSCTAVYEKYIFIFMKYEFKCVHTIDMRVRCCVEVSINIFSPEQSVWWIYFFKVTYGDKNRFLSSWRTTILSKLSNTRCSLG